ncbi:hypothetical protein [Acinetobacter calcoaceticus]|uniref:hypothetical protein n=1 Tax=Acinetobacter calcoaceticus TaxID=471 RepID=UPI0002CE83FC|nr:hypothetical protein [Acinetobacter calcoaceticus]ENU07773.1 hypothetical protein F997_03636 [Acinetobacter calcoaceticus NIPH 13]
MSYTTILAIHPEEKVEELFELGNAWGSAPVIWDAIAQKYLGKSNFMAATLGDSGAKLWALCRDESVPLLHRTVHLMTMDRMFIEKKDFKQAAQDIRAFLNDFPQPENHINHWPTIAEYLETEPEIPAIGFHMTSVSENPFYGEWDDESESYGNPDWTTCRSVYGSIQGSTEA